MLVRVGALLAISWASTVSVGCFDFGSVSAGSSGDGGTDGAAGGSFCATLSPAPTFCEDFDEPGWTGNWDQILQENGSVTADSVLAFSAPDSLLTQTSAAASGVPTEADALKEFAQFQGKPIQITASFEMNVQAWDTSSSGQCIAFEIIFKNSSSQFNQIVLNLNSLGTTGVAAQVAENAQGPDGGESGYNSYPIGQHPPTNSWTKVEVDLLIGNPNGAGGNSITVKLDGMPQLSQQALQVPLQGGPPWMHLGLGYVGTPAQAWSIRYDNFVVSVTGVP